ncbi:carbohydrate porin, partial [Flavobacterium branchiophilum]
GLKIIKMNKKMLQFGFCALVATFSISKTMAQETYPRFGLGFQASFPAVGLSAKAEITAEHTAQAVVGILGPFSSYYGRYNYNFPEKNPSENVLYKPYLYAQAGYYVYDFDKYLGISTGLKQENSLGYGLGAGLEWAYKPFSKDFKFSSEIGYSKVNFEYYHFKSITFGVGLHYYFN